MTLQEPWATSATSTSLAPSPLLSWVDPGCPYPPHSHHSTGINITIFSLLIVTFLNIFSLLIIAILTALSITTIFSVVTLIIITITILTMTPMCRVGLSAPTYITCNCSRTFPSLSALERHMSTDHPENTSMAFTQCSKQFPTYNKLQ